MKENLIMGNKHYFNKEIAYPLIMAYRLGYDCENEIEEYDFLKELFDFLLTELNARIDGASYLLEEVKVGENIDDALFENDDKFILDDFDEEEIKFDDNCQLIAIKRLKALQTFKEAIDILFNMFYNRNVKDLEKLVIDNQRR